MIFRSSLPKLQHIQFTLYTSRNGPHFSKVTFSHPKEFCVFYRIQYKTQWRISPCELNGKRNVFPVSTSAVEIDPGHHTCRGCCFNRTMPNLHLKSFFHFMSHMKNGTMEKKTVGKECRFLALKSSSIPWN